MKKSLRIAVVYSLPTKRALASRFADTEIDTVDSAEEVRDALKKKGAMVTMVPVSESAIPKTIAAIRADCIFNLIDWTGLDLHLSDQALSEMEKLHIPTTGASRGNFLCTADKITLKQALVENRLPTPRHQLFLTGDEPVRPDFVYPVIAKLAYEHCSIGLGHDSVVKTPHALTSRVRERIASYGEPIIAEEFIIGREFQVTVVETPTGLKVLPPAEILFDTKNTDSLLTYESRWVEGAVDYQTSRVVVPALDMIYERSLRRVAIDTFTKLKFSDYCRLDIRTQDHDVYILEANCNPGLSDSDEYSLALSFQAAGYSFADFVWMIVESTLRRAKWNLPA